MSRLTVLNLGLGVQSSCLYLLSLDGELPPLDWSIFADPQEERRYTYEHLAWLRSQAGSPIITGTAGKLGDHLLAGTNSTGQRFASVPAFTTNTDHDERGGAPSPACSTGRVQRQCTKEYKVEVVAKVIRRQILGLKPRQRIPKGTTVIQWYGISDDEAGRRKRIIEAHAHEKWSVPRFPLCEMGWTRARCRGYLARRVPHEVRRSACVFCPFQDDGEWWAMKRDDPEAFARAVVVDEGLRRPGAIVNRGLNQKLYLHRTCLPLTQIDFESRARALEGKPKQPDLFGLYDCGQGMCGV